MRGAPAGRPACTVALSLTHVMRLHCIVQVRRTLVGGTSRIPNNVEKRLFFNFSR